MGRRHRTSKTKCKRTSKTKCKPKSRSRPTKAKLQQSQQFSSEAKFQQTQQRRAAAAHAAAKKLWPTKKENPLIAPLEGSLSCKLADKYIQSWEPGRVGKQVNLLILAESHARTPSELLGKSCIDVDTANTVGHYGHLNIVHCITYGESWLMGEDAFKDSTTTAKIGCTSGTLQFWRLLAALSGHLDVREDGGDPLEGAEKTTAAMSKAFSSIEGTSKDSLARRNQRIQAKAVIKQQLMERGIQLADVSPEPLYAGGGNETRTNQTTGNRYTTKTNKLPKKTLEALLSAAFEKYAEYLIQRSKPKLVLVFGKTVEKAIGKDRLAQVVEKNGGHYLCAIQHPSYNCIRGRKFLPHLRMLRDLALKVQGPTDAKDLQAMIEQKLSEKMEIPK